MSPAGFIAGSGLGAYVARILFVDHVPPSPELTYAYSDAEFNEEFGPTALADLARRRAEARRRRKDARRARYMRRHDRFRRYADPTKYVVVAELPPESFYAD
jgi:hypothetical protein